MNSICQLHDIFCDCYHPLEHTITTIIEKEGSLQFSAPEKQLIKKCLSGEEITTTVPSDGDADGVEEGVLEKLFEEPFTEDDSR